MDREETKKAILDGIGELLKVGPTQGMGYAAGVRDLAEAYAWLTSTAQPHGGAASGSSA